MKALLENARTRRIAGAVLMLIGAAIGLMPFRWFWATLGLLLISAGGWLLRGPPKPTVRRPLSTGPIDRFWGRWRWWIGGAWLLGMLSLFAALNLVPLSEPLALVVINSIVGWAVLALVLVCLEAFYRGNRF